MEAIERDIYRIGHELMEELKNNLKVIASSDLGINKKVGINTLKDSDLIKQMDGWVILNGYQFQVDLVLNYYVDYIVSGRKKGAKMIPIAPLIVWLKRKNIPTTNKNIRSTAFMIAKAIQRDGIEGRDIITPWLEKYDDTVEIYIDKMFERIMSELNNYLIEI